MRRLPTILCACLALAGATLSTTAFLSTAALADDNPFAQANPLGFYVGGAVGESMLDQRFFDEGADAVRNFGQDRFGWKVLVGVRPLPWLGAEAEYIDFGNAHLGPALLDPSSGPSGGQFFGARGSASAGALFAVGYLPLPPWFDLFGKIGFARLQTRYTYAGDYPNSDICTASGCTSVGGISLAQDTDETHLAYGGGVQFHLGPAFATRVEFERLNGLAGDPYLVSVGLTWMPP
ncbi:MAG: outer membrane beta-barrel protein [Steroidobacteraceae bacterium]